MPMPIRKAIRVTVPRPLSSVERAARVVALALAATALAACTRGSDEPQAEAPLISGYGWGSDAFGQLGAVSNGHSPSLVPVPLPSGTTSVALGADFAIALAGGRVYTWGHNEHGQLGDGTRRDRHEAKALDLPDVVAVAAGERFGLALTDSGALYSWGQGSSGQLGDGATSDRATPQHVPVTGRRFEEMAAGPHHVLATTSTGAVYAWGKGTSGQLGTGRLSSTSDPAAINLPGGAEAQTVAAGPLHSLAVTTEGRLLAWGSNSHGRLGLGSRHEVLTPTEVPSAGHAVTAVAAGSAASIALTDDGDVLAAGRNDAGQLGDRTTTDRDEFGAVKLPAEFDASSVAAGPAQGFVLSRDGTQILAWGEGSGWRLGTGDDRDVLTPEPVQDLLPAGAVKRRYVEIVGGYASSIALARQGAPTRLAVEPQGPPAVGEPFDIRVIVYDTFGNDLGSASEATAELTGGSCDGLTCTPKSEGKHTLTVKSGGLSTRTDIVATAERPSTPSAP